MHLNNIAMRINVSMRLTITFIIMCIQNKVLSSQSGYCQIYSYNIKHRQTGIQEKHLFVCCNNLDEKQCYGSTYQKPSRSEAFCTGEVVQSSGNHWTEMESSAFPDNGHFYCGGCCGQHIAWEACTEQAMRPRKNTCLNWVQCFQRQCNNVIKAVLRNQPLKCTLPPAPHPKHYIHDQKKLPANLTGKFTPPMPGSPLTGLHSFNNNSKELGCTKDECQSMTMTKRCMLRCCAEYCCLPDGPMPYDQGGHLLLGLSTVQVVAIVIGSIALLIAFAAIILLTLKRFLPGCRNFHFSAPHDTQILVIDGPEDGDSDVDDVEDDSVQEDDIEVESA